MGLMGGRYPEARSLSLMSAIYHVYDLMMFLLIISKHKQNWGIKHSNRNFLSSAFQSQTDLNSTGLTAESRRLAHKGALIIG